MFFKEKEDFLNEPTLWEMTQMVTQGLIVQKSAGCFSTGYLAAEKSRVSRCRGIMILRC